MLAIQARSFNNYYYISPTNTNHPARFAGNLVAGIIFENKVDYTSTLHHTLSSPFTPLFLPLANSPTSILRLHSTPNPRHPHAPHLPSHLLLTPPPLRPSRMEPILQ
jgi:hypothetical protein